MKYPYILFDLDGTVTDPKEGIAKCVVYSLEQLGLEAEPWESYGFFIGPPLVDTYMEMGLKEDEIEEAIRLFRVRFSDVGWKENVPYEGIDALLESLSKEATLAIATSKPTIFAKRILDHFNLSQYFDVIVGSELDGTRNNKADVIEEALRQLKRPSKDQVVMIGDRKHDIEGANVHSIDAIRVLYGYGEPDEHKTYKTLATAASLEDLSNLLS